MARPGHVQVEIANYCYWEFQWLLLSNDFMVNDGNYRVFLSLFYDGDNYLVQCKMPLY